MAHFIYVTGDIFTASCQALVNPVNCVGVMGAGLAAQFKERYRENYIKYVNACREKAVQIGTVHVFRRTAQRHIMPRFIINFPTKHHWRDKSTLEGIEAGLVSLRAAVLEHSIRSIAIPALGCGLGSLNWMDVRLRISSMLLDVNHLEVWVYEPQGGEI